MINHSILQHGQEEEGEQAPERLLRLLAGLAARVQPERLHAGGEVLQGHQGNPHVAGRGSHRRARVRSTAFLNPCLTNPYQNQVYLTEIDRPFSHSINLNHYLRVSCRLIRVSKI